MMKPLLVVLVSHACTAAVASTVMYSLDADADTPLATAAPATGALSPLTPSSVHAPLATEIFTVPAALTLFRNNVSVAFETWMLVVPAGSAVRSNCASACAPFGPPTAIVLELPKLVALPGSTYESCVSGTFCANAATGMIASPHKNNLIGLIFNFVLRLSVSGNSKIRQPDSRGGPLTPARYGNPQK
jgi:hypothetical protein